MRRRPLIGITGPSSGGGAAWIMTSVAIVRAGGRPRRITPDGPVSAEELDGLVIGGGADIDRELYREASESLGEAIRAAASEDSTRRSQPRSRFWTPAVFLLRKVLARRVYGGDDGLDRPRDELEGRLLARAVERGLPVLGICRGAQLMNVFFGGTLHADVREFYVETPHVRSVLPRRLVRAQPGSRLVAVVGASSFSVNALHHQAVRAVGRGLAIVARDEGGVVQAIEQPSHAFRLGVQWHPEYIPQHPRQRALFRGLVSAARGAS